MVPETAGLHELSDVVAVVRMSEEKNLCKGDEKLSWDKLNSLMMQTVLPKIWKCWEHMNVPGRFKYSGGGWVFAFHGAGMESVVLDFSFSSQENAFDLTVQRDGYPKHYAFRDENELQRIIPLEPTAFAERWTSDEQEFASKLPRSIARGCGINDRSR
jgi:hypothetical protein